MECASCSATPQKLSVEKVELDPESNWVTENARGHLTAAGGIDPAKMLTTFKVKATLEWCPVEDCDIKLTVWVEPLWPNTVDMDGGDKTRENVSKVVGVYSSTVVRTGAQRVYGSSADRTPIGESAFPEFDATQPLGSAKNPTGGTEVLSFPDHGRWFCIHWTIDPNDPAKNKLTLVQKKKVLFHSQRKCE